MQTIDVKECPRITEGKASTRQRPILLDGREVYSYHLTARGADARKVSYVPDPNAKAPVIFANFENGKYNDTISKDGQREKCQRGTFIIKQTTTRLKTKERRYGFMIDLERFNEDDEVDRRDPRIYYTIKGDKLTKFIDRGEEEEEEEKVLLDYASASDAKGVEDDSESDGVLLDSKDNVALLVSPESKDSPLAPYINCFVGILSGECCSTYTYKVREYSDQYVIINKPLHGFVHLRTVDGRFYLKYERTLEGALAGEVIRTQLIPYHESAKENEVAGCLHDTVSGTKVPVYLSYYDPAGSGRQITREAYEEYLKQKAQLVQETMGVPKELAGLLGF